MSDVHAEASNLLTKCINQSAAKPTPLAILNAESASQSLSPANAALSLSLSLSLVLPLSRSHNSCTTRFVAVLTRIVLFGFFAMHSLWSATPAAFGGSLGSTVCSECEHYKLILLLIDSEQVVCGSATAEILLHLRSSRTEVELC